MRARRSIAREEQTMKNKLARLLSAVSLLAICLAGPVAGADISTHSFSGCAFPDTNQSSSYSATFGEDHDYASSVSTMNFTVYNPVGSSSVTVDNRTGLMWVTNPMTDAGMSGGYTWANALSACEGLGYAGYADWRLPNARELMSIVDYGTALSPRIDGVAFPGTQPAGYWTSTTYVSNPGNAFAVPFNVGTVGSGSKATALSVRCVRGGP